jgi:hypothetical protein
VSRPIAPPVSSISWNHTTLFGAIAIADNRPYLAVDVAYSVVFPDKVMNPILLVLSSVNHIAVLSGGHPLRVGSWDLHREPREVATWSKALKRAAFCNPDIPVWPPREPFRLCT